MTESKRTTFNPAIKTATHKMPIRRLDSQKIYGSQGRGSSGPDRSPDYNAQGGRMGRPYDFDSYISTEEAFFTINEEYKIGHNFRGGEGGSNPQEDGGNMRFALAVHKHETTGANFLRRQCTTKSSQLNQKPTLGFNPNRQRTQRLSPKGQSMIGKDAIAENQSLTIIDNMQSHKDDSNGSGKLQSEQVPVASGRFGRRPIMPLPTQLILLTKHQSNQMVDSSDPCDTPLLKKSQDSNSLIEDSFFLDFKESDTPPDKLQSSRRLGATDSEEEHCIRGIGANVPDYNLSRQQINSNSSKDRSLNKRSDSHRLLQQQAAIQHTGQGSMRLDMKFGWRPNFNDRSQQQKEAIAIKLTYPNNTHLLMSSIRTDPSLSTEIYRNNKNIRTIKKDAKNNFVAGFESRLVYQGYRPSVSLELHLRFGQKVGFNEESQFYDVVIPKSIKAKALESGLLRLTPRSPVDDSLIQTYVAPENRNDCDLVFDSQFESGNLDLAIQVQPREFNLYLRPDTNTKGYCNWFFFKITRRADSKGKYPATKYQFSILNMYKKKTLYRQEAKPLVCFSEIHKKGFTTQQLEFSKWQTTPFSNIGYGLAKSHAMAVTPMSPNSNSQPLTALNKNQTILTAPITKSSRKQKFYCLAFDFEFPSGQEFAYIASSIPYQYTFLQKTIRTHAKLDQSMTTLTRTLGGLQTPLLTITNEVINISKKRTVIICGRIHPGETNSSWILHGIIDFLVSKAARHLRDNLVFKIVPMVNPDGVVAGNYRTSFIGKDLNRLYSEGGNEREAKYGAINEILKPEITAMQQLIKDCKTNDESRGILAFIDVHHHSQQRGSFMFGPSYQMHNSKYMEVRVLPKLMSMMLPEIFRFQSCKFKNQSYKENCARLYCDKEAGITYSFCLECSQQGYHTLEHEPGEERIGETKTFRHVKQFDQKSLMLIGRKMCEALNLLNEMSNVQDQKRVAIQKRKKLRSKKNKKGKGKGGAKNSKAGEGASAFGNTDFDACSDYSNTMSFTSQDYQQIAGGGVNPKIGIKGFISQMMSSSGSTGGMRRQMTHFGSQDAVSEKSEKDEESMSGSDGGSSGQDLSDDEQQAVYDQVLDILMPGREKNKVAADKTVEEDPIQKRPIRSGLKSANRIVLIDKKAKQKEQLMIPKAVFDIQVNQNTNCTSFAVSNQPFDPFGASLQMEDQARSSIVNNKTKDDKQKKPTIQVSQLVHGCTIQTQKQGYTHQNAKQEKKQRIQSSRTTRRQNRGVDFFDNPRIPMKPDRPPAVSSLAKNATQNMQFANIYNMVKQQQQNQKHQQFLQNQQTGQLHGAASDGKIDSKIGVLHDLKKSNSYKRTTEGLPSTAAQASSSNMANIPSFKRIRQSDTAPNEEAKINPELLNIVDPITSMQSSQHNRDMSQTYSLSFFNKIGGTPAESQRQHNNFIGQGHHPPQVVDYHHHQTMQPNRLLSQEAASSELILFDDRISPPLIIQKHNVTSQGPAALGLGHHHQGEVSKLQLFKDAQHTLANNQQACADKTVTLSAQQQQQQQQAEQRATIPLSQGGFFHRNQITGGGRRELARRVNKVTIKRDQQQMMKSPQAAVHQLRSNKPVITLSQQHQQNPRLLQQQHQQPSLPSPQPQPLTQPQRATPLISRITQKRSSAQTNRQIETKMFPSFNNVDIVGVDNKANYQPLSAMSNTAGDSSANLTLTYSKRRLKSDTSNTGKIFGSPQKQGRIPPAAFAQTVAKKSISSKLHIADGVDSMQPRNSGTNAIIIPQSGTGTGTPLMKSRARKLRAQIGQQDTSNRSSSHWSTMWSANKPPHQAQVIVKRALKPGKQPGFINKIFHKKNSITMGNGATLNFNQTQVL